MGGTCSASNDVMPAPPVRCCGTPGCFAALHHVQRNGLCEDCNRHRHRHPLALAVCPVSSPPPPPPATTPTATPIIVPTAASTHAGGDPGAFAVSLSVAAKRFEAACGAQCYDALLRMRAETVAARSAGASAREICGARCNLIAIALRKHARGEWTAQIARAFGDCLHDMGPPTPNDAAMFRTDQVALAPAPVPEAAPHATPEPAPASTTEADPAGPVRHNRPKPVAVRDTRRARVVHVHAARRRRRQRYRGRQNPCAAPPPPAPRHAPAYDRHLRV